MSDDRTPLQRLDDAVHDFAAAVGTRGTVGAWALAYEATKLIDEPGTLPLMHAAGYAIGPGTSPATADGLTSGLAARCRRATLDSLLGEPGEDPE